jgi:hypothetical protein
MAYGGANKNHTLDAYSACYPTSDSVRFKFTVEATGSPYSSRGKVTLEDVEIKLLWTPCGTISGSSTPTLPDDPLGIFRPTPTSATLPDDPLGIFKPTPTSATLPDDPLGIFKPTPTSATLPDDPFGILKPSTSFPDDPFGIFKPTTTTQPRDDPFGIFTRKI